MFKSCLLVGLLFLACNCSFLYPPMIDDKVAQQATLVGDEALSAEVAALKNQGFSPGSGEFQVGLCLQQYVRARAAEVALSTAKDDYNLRLARNERLMGYSSCQHMCKQAEKMPSKYTAIAVKYTPKCVAGAATSLESTEIAELERLVDRLGKATQPLGLYLADKDVTAMVDYLRKKDKMTAKSEALAAKGVSLRTTHADAIAKGAAFYEGSAAQSNFKQRAVNESKQQGILNALERIEAERDEARDAGLTERVYNLNLAIDSKRKQLAMLRLRHAKLKERYVRMAEDAGVYKAP